MLTSSKVKSAGCVDESQEEIQSSEKYWDWN